MSSSRPSSRALPHRVSLVHQVVEILLGRLRAGELSGVVPSERQLCRELQVSRKTLRAALRNLERGGHLRVADSRRRIVTRATTEAPRRPTSQKVALIGANMARRVHDRWAVWSGGLKQNHLDLLPHGCDGYLSSFITFKPSFVREYCAAIDAHDLARARSIVDTREKPWIDQISRLPGGFDAGMHGMLEIYGLAKRWRRKPYYSLADGEMEQLRDVLEKLKLL